MTERRESIDGRTVMNWIARLGSWLGVTDPIRQAGGIVVRRDNGVPRVLIVTARKRRRRWVLPKGTVEQGERPAATALREIREEAGVTGKVIAPAGTTEYNARAGRVRVQYYLIEFKRATNGRREDRDVRWCVVEDAMKKLTYANARRVLLSVKGKIARPG